MKQVWKKTGKCDNQEGAPVWVCPVCGKGAHTSGLEAQNDLSECPDCGEALVYPADASRAEIGNLLFGHSRGAFRVPRELEDMFCEFMESEGLDFYGYCAREGDPRKNKRGGVTTSLYEINPYYWGDDESEEEEANFLFKPTNLKISWYKYPLRDSYSNLPVTKELLEAMFKMIKEG